MEPGILQGDHLANLIIRAESKLSRYSRIPAVFPVGSLVCFMQSVLSVRVVLFAEACLAPINLMYPAYNPGAWRQFTQSRFPDIVIALEFLARGVCHADLSEVVAANLLESQAQNHALIPPACCRCCAVLTSTPLSVGYCGRLAPWRNGKVIRK